MAYFFTSDPHFSHYKLANLRKFETVEAMDRHLVDQWNSVVTDQDVVYCLGDFAWRQPEYKVVEILKKLRGTINWIPGNHDSGYFSHYTGQWKSKARSLLDLLHPKVHLLGPMVSLKLALAEDQEAQIVMGHYPIHSWAGKHHGAWHLFGHVHGHLPDYHKMVAGNAMDVGVDAHPEMRPFSVAEIRQKLHV